MILSFTPIFGDSILKVMRRGDCLIINGIEYDFEPFQEGNTLPAGAINCDFIVGPVERIGGKVLLTLLLPIKRAVFMEDLPDIVDPSDGPIDLPVIAEAEDD